MYRIGIDVGGTFTDLVAIDDAGDGDARQGADRRRTTRRVGVLDGLTAAGRRPSASTAPRCSRQTDRIVHGTTVATNALLERKGARLGLLTTEGHRDVIEMREGLKDDRYNLRLPPPEQLVPRHLRLGGARADARRRPGRDPARPGLARRARSPRCRQRAGRGGRGLLPARLARSGARARDRARRSPARCPTSTSRCRREVLPQIKEFERVSTTIVNAYVGPVLSRYLARLEARLGEAGYRGPDPDHPVAWRGRADRRGRAARRRRRCCRGRPAGSPAASTPRALAGDANLIPFDMGGTSTDICLVVDGEATLVMDRRVGGHRIALNSLDIASIGAGGGSIARVDAGGILHVGPESAGAVPGPACYGQGGTAATVTDANLVLGYLDPASFLGGERRLDRAAAERAVDRIAAALGIDRLAAARGIHRIVNTNMAEGVRLVSVRRGVDPRRFALFAFGGAAGLHATDIARQLGLGRVIVPRVAAVLSAWGMLATDLRFEVVAQPYRRHRARSTAPRSSGCSTTWRPRACARLRASFAGPARAAPRVDMRYGEQVFEITVPLDDVDWSAADPLPQIVERFHRRHEALYTYSMPDQESVLVNARVTVSGILEELPQEPTLPPAPPAAPQRRAPHLSRRLGRRRRSTISTRWRRGRRSPGRRSSNRR